MKNKWIVKEKSINSFMQEAIEFEKKGWPCIFKDATKIWQLNRSELYRCDRLKNEEVK